MTRMEESFDMVDLILDGDKYKKLKEANEKIDVILEVKDDETGPDGHIPDGSGPPEHGKGEGPGEGKEECKEDESAYQKFFKQKLEKYGVKSPNELSKEKKKDFFNSVDTGWKGEKE